jgi:hypothetical protein
MDLGRQLADRHWLRLAEVVPSDPDAPELLTGVAIAAAAELEKVLRSEEPRIIALGTGRALKATVALAATVIASPHVTKLVLGMLRENVLYGRATLAKSFDAFLVYTVDCVFPGGDPDSFPADSIDAYEVEVDKEKKTSLMVKFAELPFNAAHVRSAALDGVYANKPNYARAVEVHEAFQQSPTREHVTVRVAVTSFIVSAGKIGDVVDDDDENSRLCTPRTSWKIQGLFGRRRQAGSGSPWPSSTSHFASDFNVEVTAIAEAHAIVMAVLKVTNGELCDVRALLSFHHLMPLLTHAETHSSSDLIHSDRALVFRRRHRRAGRRRQGERRAQGRSRALQGARSRRR